MGNLTTPLFPLTHDTTVIVIISKNGRETREFMFPEKKKEKKIEWKNVFFRYLDTILRSTVHYSYRASEVRDPALRSSLEEDG